VQGFGNSILEAQNKLRFKAIIYLVFLILGTGFGAYLAREYGAVGMIIGSVTGWVIVQNVMNVYYYKVIQLNIPRFFKELGSRILPAFLLTLAVGWFINFIPGCNWMNFIIKAVLYTITYAFIMFFIGLNEFEKNLFTTTIGNLTEKSRTR